MIAGMLGQFQTMMRTNHEKLEAIQKDMKANQGQMRAKKKTNQEKIKANQ
jgi:uncharacterized membrane protein (DUF106 family)